MASDNENTGQFFIAIQGQPNEYARVQQLQNNGYRCPHCISPRGHYAHCMLLNRQPSIMADKQAYAVPHVSLTQEDYKLLKQMCITW